MTFPVAVLLCRPGSKLYTYSSFFISSPHHFTSFPCKIFPIILESPTVKIFSQPPLLPTYLPNPPIQNPFAGYGPRSRRCLGVFYIRNAISMVRLISTSQVPLTDVLALPCANFGCRAPRADVSISTDCI